MRKSIIIGVSIVSVLAILFAVALGFAGANIKVFAPFTIKEAQIIKDKQTNMGETLASTSTPTLESTPEKTAEMAIMDAQTKVSFKILQPSYIPEGYTLNIPQISGTRFKGVSSELEQAELTYIKKNETLSLQELLVIEDNTADSKNAPKIPWIFVDINGVQGRFLERSDGGKQLSWEIGSLNLTISSFAYNGDGFTGTSLNKEEMIKMARSVK